MIRAAMPVMGEMDCLPNILPKILQAAEGLDFRLFVCVNQPDEWWGDAAKKSVCEENRACLQYLRKLKDARIEILDYSSRGRGWKGKKHGVGHARRVAMDAAVEAMPDDALLVSLDADTQIPKEYFRVLLELQQQFPQAAGMALPYYHPLSGDAAADRAILRYELFMRYYSLNLWQTDSPYRFTALGSAMACPVKTYRKIGGITPKMSGEDFYFLQKIRKAGNLLVYSPVKVYPASRFSARVYFGTGPAMIRGADGDWTSYPFYDPAHFMEIRQFYQNLPALYQHELDDPVLNFLHISSGGKKPWQDWRANASSVAAFRKAAHQAFDGLRILQYLRHRREGDGDRPEALKGFVEMHFPEVVLQFPDMSPLGKPEGAETGFLNALRDAFVRKEEKLQKTCPLI